MEIESIDQKINEHISSQYAGYRIEKWASGMGGGVRDIAYDIFLKDGSRFCVDGFFDVETGKISTREREYSP